MMMRPNLNTEKEKKNGKKKGKKYKNNEKLVHFIGSYF